MRHKLAMIFVVAIGLFMISTSLFAHHGNAAYDTDKKVSVSGTVTAWLWANPHCFLKIDGKNDKGEQTHWIVETSNPQDMARQGWARNSFKPGDEVSLTIIAAKNERSIGRFVGKDNFLLNGKPFPPVGKQWFRRDGESGQPVMRARKSRFQTRAFIRWPIGSMQF